MGPLALFDALFARIKRNEKLHLAWCCTGVIGCLIVYGVLQVRPLRALQLRGGLPAQSQHNQIFSAAATAQGPAAR